MLLLKEDFYTGLLLVTEYFYAVVLLLFSSKRSEAIGNINIFLRHTVYPRSQKLQYIILPSVEPPFHLQVSENTSQHVNSELSENVHFHGE